MFSYLSARYCVNFTVRIRACTNSYNFTPFVRAILFLKYYHSTTADVYLFWLIAVASLQETIQLDIADLSISNYEKIRTYANIQFNKIINRGSTNSYLTAFVLDPVYHNGNILKTINPSHHFTNNSAYSI
jgi:hypothetical protein